MGKKLAHWFSAFSKWASHVTGHATVFCLAIALIVVWAASGPIFGFSDTWQLVINTTTTIVTFLMVFLIQNTQNRDTGAIQTKLDELLRAVDGAHKALLDLEELEEADIERIRKGYREMAQKARKELRKGGDDTGTEDIQRTDKKASGSK